MLFTVLDFPILPSYSTNQNRAMTIDNPREPRYGGEGAVLSDFRQKHQPHGPLVKAIGDDKKTMERCPVWGVPWLSPPPGPLPEENKQDYLRQKDRKKKKKLEAKLKAKAKAKAKMKVKVEVEAKTAVLKNVRGRKKGPRSRTCPSSGAGPIPQLNPTTYAPPPAPSTTQWTKHGEGRAPSLSLPQVVAPWQSSSWVAMDRHRPRAPAPTISTFYDESHYPPFAPMGMSQEHDLGTSGSSSQHAMPGNLYVTQAHFYRLAQQARVPVATSFHPPKSSSCVGPSPYRPMPSLIDRQHRPCGKLQPGVTVEYNASTDAECTTPLSSDADSRRPSMDPSPSPLSTCAETPGCCATPPPHTASQPHAGLTTAHGPVGPTTKYVGTACQDFARADHYLSGNSPSGVVLAPTPKLTEDDLKIVQVNGGCVPQAHPPSLIDDRFDVIVVRPPRGGHSVVWPAASAIALHIDHERSDETMRVDNTYTYEQDVPVHCQPASSSSTDDVKACPRKQCSYSELSGALQEPASTLRDQCARPNMGPLAARSWPVDPPAASVGFHNSVGSDNPRLPYAQSPVINHTQSGTGTHLWSQDAMHAPPLYPYDGHGRTSTIPASGMMANQPNLTHIDNQRFEMRYGHRAPA